MDSAATAGLVAFAQVATMLMFLGFAVLLVLCVIALVVALRSDRRKRDQDGRT